MKATKWTTQNIPDLSGKTMIVTGGNSGLGFESVKAFASKGAHVILASRSIEKGEEAKKQMGSASVNVQVMPLDLQDFASIENFASAFKKEYQQLDVLLNNAGIMTTPYFKTKDGLEAQNGTNHFGHFKLTALLLSTLMKTPKSRVVTVSSSAHKMGKMDFDNFFFEKGGYTSLKSYGRSKLSNLLFTYELQRLFEKHNIDCTALSAHPGVSQTNLGRYIDGKFLYKVLWPVFKHFTMTQDQGALPQIRACVDPQAKGGEFYGPHKGMTGFPVVVKSNTASHNLVDAKKLWAFSEEITNEKCF
ncbi:MAG: SDR family NAD(P)-dependent oxidoreductase [Bacteroidales bacterium]|nr:SDR family NAD(P)-dependent oxidoreductase [Bacteroidales bacterium]